MPSNSPMVAASRTQLTVEVEAFNDDKQCRQLGGLTSLQQLHEVAGELAEIDIEQVSFVVRLRNVLYPPGRGMKDTLPRSSGMTRPFESSQRLVEDRRSATRRRRSMPTTRSAGGRSRGAPSPPSRCARLASLD